ncbi:HD domain-containing protein [Streptomyces sp. enrichment culture]|uniref:HD domain-containing protein n=1 Tax=Streptomyces sp. enrichment culture TaxID=1795815 RepID=UPI003F5750E7
MRLPTVEEIRALHLKYAPTPEAFDLVHTHCEIVWSIARELIARSAPPVDADLVRTGCLLHDIGVYRLYDSEGRLDHRQYIRHGVLGHEILRAENLPERVCRFCSCHTGVGLTKHDILAQGLPVPPGDYLAETAEERLVMYADKFHSKSNPPRFLSASAYARFVERFGGEKVAAFWALREEFGEPDVTALAARFGHRLTER